MSVVRESSVWEIFKSRDGESRGPSPREERPLRENFASLARESYWKSHSLPRYSLSRETPNRDAESECVDVDDNTTNKRARGISERYLQERPGQSSFSRRRACLITNTHVCLLRELQYFADNIRILSPTYLIIDLNESH